MPAAIVLYHEALVSFAAAYAIGRGDTTAPTAPSLAEALAILDDPLRSAHTNPAALERMKGAAGAPPDGAPGSPRDLRALVRAADDVTAAARRVAHFPSVARVQAMRAVRVGAVVVGLAAVLAALVVWLRAPANVARGKRVIVSSVRIGSPEGLVNGAIEWGTFAFHTNSGTSWVTVDLGRPYALTEVRVYNRGDSYLDESVPLTIEHSLDDRSYSPGGECSEFFNQALPCRVALSGVLARYVRVSNPRYIALSEIEVLGR
jgi:hypothetical protein